MVMVIMYKQIDSYLDEQIDKQTYNTNRLCDGEELTLTKSELRLLLQIAADCDQSMAL